MRCIGCGERIEVSSEERECFDCNGSGIDSSGGDCGFCSGTGYLMVDDYHCACDEEDHCACDEEDHCAEPPEDHDPNACPGCGGNCASACR